MISLSVTHLQAGKFQPRRRFDDASLTELASSIKVQGIMQPIIVRQIASAGAASGTHPGYEIIAGERRFRASSKTSTIAPRSRSPSSKTCNART